MTEEIKQVVTTRYAVGDKVFDTHEEAYRHIHIEALSELLSRLMPQMPNNWRAELSALITDNFDDIHEIMRGDASCRDC
jgi:hypothetical protein